MSKLILASSSPWRKELLARLGIPFECQAADVDESPLSGEDPLDLARRLARAKASRILAANPDALVIGSDQVCHSQGRIFGKPMDPAKGREQLLSLSGQQARFISSICLLGPGFRAEDHALVHVEYRPLSEAVVEEYLRRDPAALGCAGACRAEDLGIALMSGISSDDPTALIGLPLIKLAGLLAQAGIKII